MRQLTLLDDLILPMRSEPLEALDFLRVLRKDGVVIGTDEVGRGALAGPVVAAAVVLTSEQECELIELGLKDSKRLSPGKREKIFWAMQSLGVKWRAFKGSPEMIDDENIQKASLIVMRESVNRLAEDIDSVISCVIVDGICEIPELKLPQWTLIRADDLIPCVSAASIIAKVLRDMIMVESSEKYPEYEFENNKGYPTPRHIEKLKRTGMSEIHRRTFCRKFLVNVKGDDDDCLR